MKCGHVARISTSKAPRDVLNRCATVVVANDEKLANIMGYTRSPRGRSSVDLNSFLTLTRAANAQRRITIDPGHAAELF